MKTALAIVCSFLLAGTPLLLAQSPSSCASQARACCKHGVTMPCCAAKSSPDSQPAPAAPASAGGQIQLSLLAPAVLIWTLPATPANSIVPTSATPSLAASAPLYALDCARLI
jgi:hypothetical protein